MSAYTHARRASLSPTESTRPVLLKQPPNEELKSWTQRWETTLARELIEGEVTKVDRDINVEQACALLLSKEIPCLLVGDAGLLDFSDVNAFLTLGATRHNILHDHPRAQDIITAAKTGHIPAELICNFSEKNPLAIVENDATVISLLELFCQGTHRVLVRAPEGSPHSFQGLVSDACLLSWLRNQASDQLPSLESYLSQPLKAFPIHSLELYSSVVSAKSSETLLEAMLLMSEEGVSSVAVMDDLTGQLLSAVSVTDVGKLVVPSESRQILSMPLKLVISQIKEPHGSTDGADIHPSYSVLPSSTMAYTMEKILATNSHRVFVTNGDPIVGSPSSSPVDSSSNSGNLTGIVSIIDILSLFAHLAGIRDVDPTRMQRRRRASSTASNGSSRSSSSRHRKSLSGGVQ